MSATGNIAVGYGYTSTAAGGTAGTLTETFPPQNFINPFLSSGVGAGQMDTPYSTSGTFTASTPVTLTLSALPGLNGGTAKAIVKLKAVLVINGAAAGSGQTITVGPGASHGCPFLTGASGTNVVEPGGISLWAAPDLAGLGTITASSNDQLKFDPGTGTAPYTIVIFGTSA